MMHHTFFNLVDEPWIPVLATTGPCRQVSLREAFTSADDVVSITGDLPTQSVALLRLLLAILHRAVDGPRTIAEWTSVRDDWGSTTGRVDRYLTQHHDRFWLCHPVHPFMQVPDLHTANDDVSELSRIICDGPGTSTFISTRLGSALDTLTWPEAARWLIHAQAYDLSGIKSGAVGDPRVKGGKGYPIGTGWAGQIGAIFQVGNNLRDTLLRNLVVAEVCGLERVDVDGDLPVWERAPLTELPERWRRGRDSDQAYRTPTGPVDLYTWPSRRVRLVGTAQEATGVVLAQGDRATPQNRHTLEPMSAWRYSEPQTKKLGLDTYMPLKHDPDRSWWRGLEALLPGTSQPAGDGGPPRRIPPALATWAAVLQSHGCLPYDLLRWRAVGVEYGSNESVFAEIVSDELELPTALFIDEMLAYQAVEAVRVAEQAINTLARLAQNVAMAAGAEPESNTTRDLWGARREQASADAFAALGAIFRDRVMTLNAQDIEHWRRNWHQDVREMLTDQANDIIDSAGPAALVGRIVSGRHIDAGLALAWFRKRLRTLLPDAYAHRSPYKEISPEGEEEA
jgi:CRISPR system Cascade subunit CasA